MTGFAANRSWTPELDRKARALAWLVLDVDGVLTDGRLHYAASGELFKSFHVRDGLAIKLARRCGLKVAILSARDTEIVAARAREIGVDEIVQGREDKARAFAELLERAGARAETVAYCGDDLQDLPALAAAGLSAAPYDAAPEVLATVDFVTGARGGGGAVRELVERLLAARGAWEPLLRALTAPAADGGR
jgi:3-deoxy-D-manno-octulosonate 8-phosphate phosphatase (KDO 8-P phosphatase)